MGCFSWLDCKTGKQIKISARPVYVLIPKQYGGGHIIEPYYDGYGHFGGYDIFDLVARWNKDTLNAGYLEPLPKMNDYGGLWTWDIEDLHKAGKTEKEIKALDNAARREYWQRARRARATLLNTMRDYKRGLSDETMYRKYGDDYEREIGISISCYDRQNARLPFPIKITYDASAVYEDCKPSKSDPKQGCN